MVDKACEEAGEHRVRVHLTAEPGVDPKQAIEIRIQGLTRRSETEEKALTAAVMAKWGTICNDSKGRWFPA